MQLDPDITLSFNCFWSFISSRILLYFTLFKIQNTFFLSFINEIRPESINLLCKFIYKIFNFHK